MASFDKAVTKTLEWEGGLTTDTGGLTKYGISQKAYPDLDIAALTIDQAKKIYKRDYWDPINLSGLTYQPLANQIFDIAVNAGPSRAKSLLKDTLIQLNLPMRYADLSVKSIQELNGRDVMRINNQLVKIRSQFYNDLAAKNSKYKKYLTGWTNRAIAFFTSDTGTMIAEAGFAIGFFFIATLIYLNRKGNL